ncbi:hypothetical protein LDFHOB_04175 [Candidatus Electronema aureum]
MPQFVRAVSTANRAGFPCIRSPACPLFSFAFVDFHFA